MLSIKHILLFSLTALSTILFSFNLKDSIPPKQTSIYDFTVNDINGKPVSLADYRGKVVLIVNVASQCGYTPQYESLQKFYANYKSKGVVVLGFPSNDFGGQEPDSNEEIKAFCSNKYNVTFPMFSKVVIKESALYEYLTKQKVNNTLETTVKWNFHKFLINRNGYVVKDYPSRTKVTDDDFLATVNELLK